MPPEMKSSKMPAHDLGFGLVDLKPGWCVRGARHAPVAVGDLPEDGLAGADPVELPAPVALGDLRPLVLGDHALHLGQQPRLGVIVDRGSVGEVHLAAEPVELVEHEHLVGVGAREPVRGQAPDRVDRAGLGCVAQRVQPGAVQPRAGVAVVGELGHDLVTVLRHPCAQRVDL